MRWFALAIAAALMLGGAADAQAGPSLLGPSGLLETPTAEALGMAQWNIGGTALWADEGADEDLVYGNVGLLSGLELGFTRYKVEDLDAETFMNVKLQVMESLPGKISVAAGLLDITDQIDRSPYVVASHDLGAGIVSPRGRFTRPQVHVGVGSGKYDGLFGAFSLMVGRQAQVILEHDSDEFNAGVRWSFPPNFGVTASLLNDFEDFAAAASVSSPW